MSDPISHRITYIYIICRTPGSIGAPACPYCSALRHLQIPISILFLIIHLFSAPCCFLRSSTVFAASLFCHQERLWRLRITWPDHQSWRSVVKSRLIRLILTKKILGQFVDIAARLFSVAPPRLWNSLPKWAVGLLHPLIFSKNRLKCSFSVCDSDIVACALYYGAL